MSNGYAAGAFAHLARDEAFVNILLSTRQADHKVRTCEELEAIMKESKRAPTREVWMHESLVDDAHRLWEEMVADLKRKPSAGCPRPLGPSTDPATRS